MKRDDISAFQQILDLDHCRRRGATRRAVPGDDVHADPGGDPRHFGADSAKSDQTQPFAFELDAFARPPGPLTDFLIHPGDVAIAFDRVDGNAETSERLEVHVTLRAGAEKDDVT